MCVVLGTHLARLATLGGSVSSTALSLALATLTVGTADPDDVLTFEIEAEISEGEARVHPPRASVFPDEGMRRLVHRPPSTVHRVHATLAHTPLAHAVEI